jgi:hypothetical protein
MNHHVTFDGEVLFQKMLSENPSLKKRIIRERRLRKQQAKAYYDSHKDEICQKIKAYRDSHKDEICQKRKAYYDSHKDEICQKNKAYRDSHKDEICQKIKAYRDSHKDRNVKLFHIYCNRCKKRSVEYFKSCAFCMSTDVRIIRRERPIEKMFKTGNVRISPIISKKVNVI